MHTRIQYLIIAWLFAGAAHASQSARFALWTASCDQSGACQASATANAIRLRLDRPGPGKPIGLVLTAPGIAVDSDLTLAVDRHPKLALNTVDDLLHDTETSVLKITSQEAKYQLLAQLRSGSKLTLIYRNQYHQKVVAELGLRGLNQAIEFIDQNQAESRILSQDQSLPQNQPIPSPSSPVPVQDQAHPTATPVAPRKHWASDLPRLMPAINGCLEWVPGADQLIGKAWASAGQVTVRAHHRMTGARVVCSLPADGSSLDAIESIEIDAAYLPGEGNPIFTPGKHNRPEDECLEHEVVTGADGKPLGWLSFPAC